MICLIALKTILISFGETFDGYKTAGQLSPEISDDILKFLVMQLLPSWSKQCYRNPNRDS